MKGLALDIDETLSWTVGYYFEMMTRLFGNPEKLSVAELVAKYKYTQNVPYWQTDKVREWMKEQWINDGLQKDLPLIEGAKEYVRKIHEIVPITLYLTTRPKAVENGTKHWLNMHGFPNAPIITRPTTVLRKDCLKWKAEVLVEKYPEIMGIIDDYEELLKFLPDYRGRVFLFDHETSETPAIPCKDWKTVYTEVKKLYIDSPHPSKS